MLRFKLRDQFLSFFFVDGTVLVQITLLEDVFRTLRQLLLRNLTVLVGIEFHQLVDKVLAGPSRSARTSWSSWSTLARTTHTAMTRAAFALAAKSGLTGTARSSALA